MLYMEQFVITDTEGGFYGCPGKLLGGGIGACAPFSGFIAYAYPSSQKYTSVGVEHSATREAVSSA